MRDTILQGDVRSCLKQLEDGSVQCVITSPPYWGLRDYGTATWEGGDPNCDHKHKTARNDGGRVNENGFHGSATEDSDKGAMNYTGICPKCGARRIDSQIGLEPTPEAYVADLVEVFREVKRVLRNDGTLWLNLGDSYATTSTGNRGTKSALHGSDGQTYAVTLDRYTEAKTHRAAIPDGLKPKDLVGIPWMVAFALRADGWYLRSDIIWNKPNPMPESVTDRCTKSHEHIFMLTKGERYYYDAEAIKEESITGDPRAPYGSQGSLGRHEGNYGKVRESVKRGGFNGKTNELEGRESFRAITETRNKRDVWTVATQPCAEAHFATFPPKLIEPMILAGTKIGDTILDPFMGSGTVAIQCVRLHRHYLGCELNPGYVKMAERRIADMVGPLFVGESNGESPST